MEFMKVMKILWDAGRYMRALDLDRLARLAASVTSLDGKIRARAVLFWSMDMRSRRIMSQRLGRPVGGRSLPSKGLTYRVVRDQYIKSNIAVLLDEASMNPLVCV